MARSHKCVFCHKVIRPDGEEQKVKSGYAHDTCFKVYMQGSQEKREKIVEEAKVKKQTQKVRTELQKKTTKVPKEGLGEEEYKEKVKLLEYISTIIDSESSVKHKVVVDRYKELHGFSYRGMYLTLKYLVEIKNKEFSSEKDGVGLIPFYYEEANKYYFKNEKIAEQQKEQLKDLNPNELIKKRVVRINPTKKKETKPLLDMEDWR